MRALFKKQLVRSVSAFSCLSFFLLSLNIPLVRAQNLLDLPVPGTMVRLTSSYNPLIIKGLIIHPEDGLKFDFIIDPGDSGLAGETLKDEANRLIKYFLAGLTVPEEDLWVNLSPYENDRIVPENLGVTEMGRDMLAQDYILKQLAATLFYPEDGPGKQFWSRVRQKVWERFGTTEVPLNTFNKVWIVPEKATLYEHGQGVFVLQNKLKVMLEEDYVALQKGMDADKKGMENLLNHDDEVISGISSAVVREVLLPEIEREVNEGETFAKLQQICNSLVLASWYKENLKNSLLGQAYADQNKVSGIDLEDKAVKDKIYAQYLESFKTGVFNYIKEESDPQTQRPSYRKYFSGGTSLKYTPENMEVINAVTGMAREAIMAGALGDGRGYKFESVFYESVDDQRAQKRLVAVGRQLEALVGNQYQYRVFSGPEEGRPAVLYISGDQTINCDVQLLSRLTNEELVAVLGHEIAHHQNNDFLLAELMSRYSENNEKARKAISLYEHHKEIEADKMSIRYLGQLGIDKENLVSGLEKALAYSRGKTFYFPIGSALDIRLEILKERIANPDHLTDFYTVGSILNGVMAIGARTEMRSDLTNIYERAETILLIYGLIADITAQLNGQDSLPALTERILTIYKGRLENDYPQGRPLADSYQARVKLGFEIAFLKYFYENTFLPQLGLFDKHAAEVLAYEFQDTLTLLSEKLDGLLEHSVGVYKYRTRANTIRSENWHSYEIQQAVVDGKLDFEFMLKSIRTMRTLYPKLLDIWNISTGPSIISAGKEADVPLDLSKVSVKDLPVNWTTGDRAAPDILPEILRSWQSQGEGPFKLKENVTLPRVEADAGKAGETVPVVVSEKDLVLKKGDSAEEAADQQKRFPAAADLSQNPSPEAIQEAIPADSVTRARVKDEEARKRRQRITWWMIPFLFWASSLADGQIPQTFIPAARAPQADTAVAPAAQVPGGVDQALIANVGANNRYGSSRIETRTHFTANWHPLLNPGEHNNIPEVQLLMVRFLKTPGVITDKMWDAMEGLGPKSVKANNKGVIVDTQDIRFYKRAFAAIKDNQKSLTRAQEIAFEAAIIAFQNWHSLTPDGDFGVETRSQFEEIFENMYFNGIFALQHPHVLSDEMWGALDISADELITQKNIFYGIDPFGRHLTGEEEAALEYAILAFQRSLGIDPESPNARQLTEEAALEKAWAPVFKKGEGEQNEPGRREAQERSSAGASSPIKAPEHADSENAPDLDDQVAGLSDQELPRIIEMEIVRNAILKNTSRFPEFAKAQNDAYAKAHGYAVDLDPWTEAKNGKEIYRNMAGIFATLESAALIAERDGRKLREIVAEILDGKISASDKRMMARIAHATWLSTQFDDAFGTKRFQRPIVKTAQALTPEQVQDDFDQIQAAAKTLYALITEVVVESLNTPMIKELQGQAEDLISLIKENNQLSQEDETRIRKTALTVFYAHREQRRKQGTPYAEHPVGVAALAFRLFGDARPLTERPVLFAVGGLLHDTREDQEDFFAEFRNFSRNVIMQDTSMRGQEKLGQFNLVLLMVRMLSKLTANETYQGSETELVEKYYEIMVNPRDTYNRRDMPDYDDDFIRGVQIIKLSDILYNAGDLIKLFDIAKTAEEVRSAGIKANKAFGKVLDIAIPILIMRSNNLTESDGNVFFQEFQRILESYTTLQGNRYAPLVEESAAALKKLQGLQNNYNEMWMQKKADQAPVSSPADTKDNYGGIDLNPAALDLQIKRDGNGVLLNLPAQSSPNINIQGLTPVIINVLPLQNLQLLLGELPADEPAPDQISKR